MMRDILVTTTFNLTSGLAHQANVINPLGRAMIVEEAVNNVDVQP